MTRQTDDFEMKTETQSENASKEPESPKKREFRGLYKHVNISVATLDKIIIGCVAVIVLLLALELRNPGFTITFDSKGGTDVAPQQQMYGEYLEVPEPPTREGYEFTGWYTDYACDSKWIQDYYKIDSDLTLYAGWQPIQTE
jgi:uncharacterized repeat protein (TIGR02543 family)